MRLYDVVRLKIGAFLFAFFLLVVGGGRLYGQTDACASSPPCPADVAIDIDTNTISFGPYIYNQAYWNQATGTAENFPGYTSTFSSGVMYKFRVIAGYTYCWDTSPNYDAESTTNMNTKITVFYDDATLPIIAQQAGGAGALAKIVWRANYDGDVFVLITREEPEHDPQGTGCGVASYFVDDVFVGDSILCSYYCLERLPANVELIRGRNGHTTTQCNLNIYDSGLLEGGLYNVRNCYSNNEDGYLTMYPESDDERVKLFGSYNLCIGDTLFVYMGNSTDPYFLVAALTGQGDISDVLAFVAQPGEPITVRLKTDEECTGEGVDFKLRCCSPPGDLDLSSLHGVMNTDTTARLSWDAASGTEVVYNWTLYDTLGVALDSGSTTSTYAYVENLHCNTDYYFTLSLFSDCLHEENPEVFFSDTFRYNHQVVLDGSARICEGDADQFFLMIQDGRVPSTLAWDIHGIVLTDTPSYCYPGSYPGVIGYPDSNFFDICITATTPSGCAAHYCFEGEVLSNPDPYVTIGWDLPNIDSVTHEICIFDVIDSLFAHGASRYTWSDAPSIQPHRNPITVHPYSTTTYTLTAEGSLLAGDGRPCTTVMEFTVIVNMPPEVEITGNDYICYGDTAVLQGHGLSSFHWQRIDTVWQHEYHYLPILDTLDSQIPLVDTVGYDSSVVVGVTSSYTTVYVDLPETSGEIYVSPSQTTTYVLSGYDDHGCFGEMAEHTVTVRFPPAIEVSSDTSICIGQGAPLSVSYVPFCGYRWWDEAHPDVVLTNMFELTVYPDSVGNYVYGVEAVSSYGCDTSVWIQVTVNPLPEVTATAFPDTLCARQLSVLTASGTPAVYSWAPDTVGNPFDIYPENTATYTVTATDANGCVNTASVDIVITESPAYEDITNPHICLGDTAAITTLGTAYQYHWFEGGTEFSTATEVSLNPSQTTDYAVFYASRTGCGDTTRFTVYVHEFPDPSVSADRRICRGDTATLWAAGAEFFLWNDPEESVTDTILVAPEETTTYMVIVYDTLLCPSYDTVTVNVIPYFDLSIIASADTVCRGDSVTFTAEGGDEYVWNTGFTSTTFTLPFDSTSVIALSALSHNTNCSHTVYDTLRVMPWPEVTITAPRDEICFGDSLELTIVGNAARYVWSTGDETTTLVVSPSITTEYTVTAYSDFGCVETASFIVTVNPLPLPFTIQVQNSRICYNAATHVSSGTTQPNLSYEWSYPGIDSETTSFTYIPQYDVVDLYVDTVTLTVTDGNGCRRSDTAAITVLPLPRDTVTAATTICRYDTLWLSCTGENNYFWTAPIPQNQSTQTAVWSVPLQDADYSVEVINQHGCMIRLSHHVTVFSLPEITVTSNNDYPQYCDNEQYALTVSGAQTYVWETGDTGETIRIAPTATTTYSVTGTDYNGCVSSTVFPVNVVSAPSVAITATPDSVICAYDELTLGAVGTFMELVWSNGSTDYELFFNDLTENTSYSVTGTRYYGSTPCSASDDIQIQVYPLPVLSIVQNTTPICSNVEGMVTVTGADRYEWQSNPLLDTLLGSSVTITPTPDTVEVVDTLVVTGILDAFGCRSSLSVPITVYPLPNIDVFSDNGGNEICFGEALRLTATGGIAYAWATIETPDAIISHGSSITVSPAQTTTYIVTVTNSFSCVDTAQFTVIVHPNPEVTIVPSEEAVCFGFPVTLTALTDGNLFEWNHPETMEDHSVAAPTAFPTATTLYTVTVTDSVTSCTTEVSLEIVVHPSPSIVSDVVSGVCYGDTLTIAMTGAAEYRWFYGSEDSIIHIGEFYDAVPTVMPVTTYGVIGIDEYGCRDTVSVPVHVNAIPEINVEVSAPGYLCNSSGNFLGISAFSSVGNTMYTWQSSPDDGSMTVNQNMAFVSPDTTTVYTVTGFYIQNGATCSATVSTEVEIRDVPSVEASAVPSEICLGNEAILTATGAVRYVWMSQNHIIGVDDIVFVAPVESTEYIVVGQDEYQCTSRDTVLVSIVSNPPTEVIEGPSEVCAGVPVRLSTSGNNHCQWMPLTGLSEISDNGVTVTVTEDIVYQIIITNENGCVDSLEYALHVLPVPELAITPDTALCEGHDVELRVSGGTSYQWNNGVHSNFQVVSPEASTTYTVTADNSYGCQSIDSVRVNIIPVFDLEIVASRDSFCLESNHLSLTATGAGDTYEWSTGETTPIIEIYPTETEEITLSAINNSTHCQASASIVITRVDNPQLTLSASSDLICENQPVTLSVVSDMPAAFLWSNGSENAEFSDIPMQTTTYAVTATNHFGCTAAADYSVTVEAIPMVSISVSAGELCIGQSAVLTAEGNAESYLWNIVPTSIAASIEVSPQVDTRYILTGYSEHSCAASDTVEISVHPLPSDQIAVSSATICYGESAVLSLSGDNTCQWTAPAEIAGAALSQITVTPTETTDYKVVITNQFGCVDSLQTTIEVIPPQELTLTPDTSICEGESLTLVVSGSWNYSWSTGATGNQVVVSPITNTTYVVSSTDLNGCTTTASVMVEVRPTFALEISHSADTLCAGDEVTLWYAGGADQYEWSLGTSEQTITDAPLTTTVYGLTATNVSTGCTLSRYDTVVVIPYPEFHIPDGNHLICESDVIIIQAENVFNFDYLWEAVPAGSILSDPTQVFIQVSPTVPTAYICHATNHYCQMTDTVFIDIVPKPDLFVTQLVDETCEQANGSISLHAVDDYPPLTFHWSNGMETQEPELTGLSEGIYSVTVTNGYGCTETLSNLIINNIPAPEINLISIIGSIGEEDGSIEIAVSSTFDDYTILWYDSPHGSPLLDYTNSTLLSGLNPGTYWVQVTDEACPVWVSYTVPQVGVGETEIWMPNAFTPSNTDGVNQYFQLYDNGKMTFNRIIIYNRWGFPIFESTDKDFRWDGRVNGKLMTNMVFNYVIYYHDSHGNNKKFVGTVTVL